MPRRSPTLQHAVDAPAKKAINDAMCLECKDRCGQDFSPCVFVIDDPETGCRSSATFRAAFPEAKIIACSTNQKLEEFEPSRHESHRFRIMCGFSTHALDDLVNEKRCAAATSASSTDPSQNFGPLDAVFLDYCGTPDRGVFEWMADVKLCLQLQRDSSCPIYLTFCRRRMSGVSSFVHQVIRDELPTHFVSDVYEYCDTSAMVIMTIRDKVCGFKYPALSSYIVPPKNTTLVVADPKFGEWTGTLVRRINHREVEVQDESDQKVYLVDANQVGLPSKKPGPKSVPQKVSKSVPKKVVDGSKRKPIDLSNPDMDASLMVELQCARQCRKCGTIRIFPMKHSASQRCVNGCGERHKQWDPVGTNRPIINRWGKPSRTKSGNLDLGTCKKQCRKCGTVRALLVDHLPKQRCVMGCGKQHTHWDPVGSPITRMYKKQCRNCGAIRMLPENHKPRQQCLKGCRKVHRYWDPIPDSANETTVQKKATTIQAKDPSKLYLAQKKCGHCGRTRMLPRDLLLQRPQACFSNTCDGIYHTEWVIE